MEKGSAHSDLIAAAIDVRRFAHAPYSNFPVGAALLTSEGQILSGCNVENASYGLTVCAERIAVCSAVTLGQKEFIALAIATSDGSPPCGACLQVLAEFCDDLTILLVNAHHPQETRQLQLCDLLPNRFDFKRNH